MPQRFLSIKNFEKYQHYKHRNPPWIKLHLEILDDPDFLELPDQAKWHYIGLLLLASRHENAIPPNTNYLSNRLHLTSPVNLSLRFLKEHVLAPRKQRASKLPTNADSETEKSRDRVETEKRSHADRMVQPCSRQLADETWLATLRINPAYRDLNIDAELGKMDAWLSTRPQKKKTRRFIVNWLNRAEKPVQGCEGMDLRTQKQAEGIQAFLKRGTA